MIINEAEIGSLLVRAKKPDPVRIREILAKAEESQGLLPEETAILLQCEDKDLVGQIFQTARKVKEQIYGKRVVLFAPLYVTNECVNNCLYCGFRKDNTGLKQ